MCLCGLPHLVAEIDSSFTKMFWSFSAQNISPTIQNSLSSYFARQAKQFTDKVFQRISDQVSIITSDEEADLAVELRNILTTAIETYRAPPKTSYNGQGVAKASNSGFSHMTSISGPSNVGSNSNANLSPLGPRKPPTNTSTLFTSKRGLNSFQMLLRVVGFQSIFLDNCVAW